MLLHIFDGRNGVFNSFIPTLISNDLVNSIILIGRWYNLCFLVVLEKFDY